MKKRIFSIVYMFVVTLVFTSMVSGVKYFSDERIQRNESLKLQKVILEVLGIGVPAYSGDKDVVDVFKSRVRTMTMKDRVVYVGYEPDGRTVTGYAFQVGGSGFWGPITGMVAVDSTVAKVVGIAFVKHSETPGLGARMTEPWFRKQFVGLPLEIHEPGEKVFYLKPEGAGKAPYELDAITGATGTSRALETFLNQELKTFSVALRQSVGKG